MLRHLATTKRILGMNARNLQVIRVHNSRAAVQIARNKLATKKRLLKNNLPTAKLYGIIRNRKELMEFNWETLPNSFVLKPNFGLGGEGIIILYGKNKLGKWISADNQLLGIENLHLHINNILDGNFSISNIPDIAYFEERMRLSEDFKNISYKGIPDIRVIVFNSVPVMAMLRLPTKTSAGKANLHMGGIGVGIDLTRGITTYAVSKQFGEITTHPDYHTSLQGIPIRFWDEILRISIAAQRAVGLGYAGVDVVIDKTQGPMILEVNGHPGLEIQNANHLTLRDRLERVTGLNITSVSKGLQVCKDLFSSDDVPENAVILGVFEPVTVFLPDGKEAAIRARMDTGYASTIITKDAASRLGYKEAIQLLDNIVFPRNVSAQDAKHVEDAFRQTVQGLHPDIVDIVAIRSSESKYIIYPKIKISLKLANTHIHTAAAVAMDNKLSQPLIIGRRDLAGFLINPSKTK